MTFQANVWFFIHKELEDCEHTNMWIVNGWSYLLYGQLKSVANQIEDKLSHDRSDHVIETVFVSTVGMSYPSETTIQGHEPFLVSLSNYFKSNGNPYQAVWVWARIDDGDSMMPESSL